MSSNDKIIILLVAPQMGENVGAAARAMKNFNLNQLRIVNPRDGWPNDNAIKVAVGAADIVNNAVIYNDLPSAIADLEYVYATSAIPRNMNKDYISSRELATNFTFEHKSGIIFGRESSGLTNEEISCANKILTIKTNKEFTSLNLAQAITIICYELFSNNNKSIVDLNIQELATKCELEFFHEHLVRELDQCNFFRVDHKKPGMVQNIKNIFNRIEKLSKTELSTLRGIIKALTRK